MALALKEFCSRTPEGMCIAAVFEPYSPGEYPAFRSLSEVSHTGVKWTHVAEVVSLFHLSLYLALALFLNYLPVHPSFFPPSLSPTLFSSLSFFLPFSSPHSLPPLSLINSRIVFG